MLLRTEASSGPDSHLLNRTMVLEIGVEKLSSPRLSGTKGAAVDADFAFGGAHRTGRVANLGLQPAAGEAAPLRSSLPLDDFIRAPALLNLLTFRPSM